MIVAEDVKSERIEIRVTSEQKTLLETASKLSHTTISNFILTHSIKAAEQEVVNKPPYIFYASEKGWAEIQQLLREDEE